MWAGGKLTAIFKRDLGSQGTFFYVKNRTVTTTNHTTKNNNNNNNNNIGTSNPP